MAAFAVYEESREESWEMDSLEITRTLRIDPFTAVPLLMAKLLGNVVVSGGRLVRTLAHRDPIHPETFCYSAKMKPVEVLASPGSTDGFNILDTPNYSNTARVIAKYKTFDFTQSSSNDPQTEKTIVSESYDFSGRNITLPQKYFSIGTGTDKILLAKEGLQATKMIPTITLQLVRHYCPNIPAEAITQLTGRVNGDVVVFAGRRWAKEVVRFEGLHSSRKLGPKASPFWEITYKFAIQNIYDAIDDSGTIPPAPKVSGYVGWNRIFRPATGRWTRITLATDADHGAYLLDSDVSQSIGSGTTTGFDLLFHPAAN